MGHGKPDPSLSSITTLSKRPCSATRGIVQNVSTTSALKTKVQRKPGSKKRGKKHRLATTMSFGGPSDKAVTPSREITRSFCSYSMKCGLTDAISVELKCGALTEVQSAPPRPRTEIRNHRASASCSRLPPSL
jgi:hypothetical protein